MPEQNGGLSAEERAELEELRAERDRRQAEEQAKRECEELERLKAQRERAEREAAKDEHARELRERNARAMEPGDDLSMPKAQRYVLLGLACLVLAIVLSMLLGGAR
ncbi:hypothetical protein [Olsenella sp. DNF00959]|uniref:hypothetical protein n=1 Tax=Olsenella sp. DNF00959 TaxID=1476999 RepID=UPI000786125D|nr:hypothetical protein [Olsenella sp. DNF00959]KXB64033.1 hypothetical protein HMPREF1868_00549 [Olsenella sp. DNF00959]